MTTDPTQRFLLVLMQSQLLDFLFIYLFLANINRADWQTDQKPDIRGHDSSTFTSAFRWKGNACLSLDAVPSEVHRVNVTTFPDPWGLMRKIQNACENTQGSLWTRTKTIMKKIQQTTKADCFFYKLSKTPSTIGFHFLCLFNLLCVHFVVIVHHWLLTCPVLSFSLCKKYKKNTDMSLTHFFQYQIYNNVASWFFWVMMTVNIHWLNTSEVIRKI